MASATTFLTRTRTEDVLDYLPLSTTTEHKKGEIIYCPGHVRDRIYLVVKGIVGVSRVAEDGSTVLLEIVRPDELFGESAFLDVPRRSERATVIDQASLMAWPIADMEGLVTKRPRLALALVQMIAQRNAEFTSRIESFSIDTIERRLARSLLHFSERLGTSEEDGSVRMMPFTHEMLSHYVGTSREVVTQHMNRFRKRGYVSYSRRGVLIHRDNLKIVLDRTGSAAAKIS